MDHKCLVIGQYSPLGHVRHDALWYRYIETNSKILLLHASPPVRAISLIEKSKDAAASSRL